MQPLELTPYIIECSEALGIIKEYESDNLLMQLVRLQRIAMKVPRNFDDVNTPLAQFQRTMRINVLQEELNSFKNSLPRNLQQNRRHLL